MQARAVIDERAHAFGVRLLQHEHAPHIGVLDDTHTRRVLVGHALHVGPLNAFLAVLERIEIRGRHGRHRLQTNAHPRVFDDVKHLPDAVVNVTEQQPPTRLAPAKRKLASCRCAEAHFLLDSCDNRAIALRNRARLIDPELRHDEQTEPFGAWLCACRPRQHEVNDVRRAVEVPIGDETLGAFKLPHIVPKMLGGRTPRADVRACVRLGEHHRRTPMAVDHVVHVPRLLRVGAELVDQRSNESAKKIKRGGRVAAPQHLECGPTKTRRRSHATQVRRQLQPLPVGIVKRLHRGCVHSAAA